MSKPCLKENDRVLGSFPTKWGQLQVIGFVDLMGFTYFLNLSLELFLLNISCHYILDEVVVSTLLKKNYILDDLTIFRIFF